MSDRAAADLNRPSTAQDAVELLDRFLRDDLGLTGLVPLHEPSFEGNEWAYVKDCLDSGWVSSAGSYVERIETMTAEACGVDHGVAVVNGTAGLHAALMCADVRPGDAVICPALTFIATANAISHCGAEPIFTDIDPANGGIDAAKLRAFLTEACEPGPAGPVHGASGRRISALVPVHLFGHPADMTALADVAREFAIPIIEDAAEALGSRYHGTPCGGLGYVGVISFNGNKTVTTGGGGIIVTNDGDLAKRLKHVTTTARVTDRWWFDHDAVGYNFRMPNINAALGCAQLEQLDTFVARKRRLAQMYASLFAGVHGVSVLREPAGCDSNHWLNAVLLDNDTERDLFLEITNDRGIQTRPCWRLIPNTEAYRGAVCADDLVTARDFVARLVNLPSGPRLLAEGAK